MFNNIYDDVEKGDGDVSSGYGSLNSHTLSQRENLSTFKKFYVDVYKGDASSGYGFMNRHTDLKHNGL